MTPTYRYLIEKQYTILIFTKTERVRTTLHIIVSSIFLIEVYTLIIWNSYQNHDT